MYKVSKKGWIEAGISFGIFAVIAVIAAFYDLQINKALYAPGCPYAQFFDNLGEMPTYFAAPVAGSILFWQRFGNTKKQHLLIKILGAGVVYCGYLVAIGVWFFGNFFADEIKYQWGYAVCCAAITSALTIAAFSKIPEKTMKKLFWFAVFLAACAILANAIVQIMKFIWARQRFRTMTPGNPKTPDALLALYPGYDYDGFTPWYMINTIIKPEIRTDAYVALFKSVDDGAFVSFPSGHTSAASTSLALIIIPELFPKMRAKNRKWMFWVFPLIYTGLVAISRIVIAAHYLSDVLFGYFIGFGSAALLRIIMLKVFSKKGISFEEDQSAVITLTEESVEQLK